MDLLNLSSGVQPPPTEFEADFLNIHEDENAQSAHANVAQPAKTNLLDISDDASFGMPAPQVLPNVCSSSQGFDFLGDLGMFSTQSAQAVTGPATTGSKRSNDIFDPFNVQSSESRVSGELEKVLRILINELISSILVRFRILCSVQRTQPRTRPRIYSRRI